MADNLPSPRFVLLFFSFRHHIKNGKIYFIKLLSSKNENHISLPVASDFSLQMALAELPAYRPVAVALLH